MYIVIGPGWVYAIGLAFAMIGFATAAPTSAHLRADQDALSGGGGRFSAVRALPAPKPQPPL